MNKIQSDSLEYLPLGYIVSDNDHKILVINRAARQLLANTKVIKTLEEVVEYLPKRLELLVHVKYCGLEHKSCSFRQVEIGNRMVRIFLSPIFEDGKLSGNLLTLEDITDQLAQENARDQFLSFLVHELRTPLTAIRSNSAMIEDYYKEILKDKDLKEIIGDINTGSKYLLGMVNQFLDMARLEEGRIQFDLQEFEVADVIRETVHSLEVLAHDRSLSLKLDIPDNFTAIVVADPSRTKQILTNLIGNALKFTSEGGVTVTVNKQQELLEIAVTDTGAGIPEESRAGMFQKYFQAANNTLKKDSSKSTGLGLYVTRLMTEGMGGKIYLAKSELNNGSTFSFTVSLSNPTRLKLLAKQKAEVQQGVQHAQISEHAAIAIQ